MRLAVHVVPHEALLLHVAKRKYLWLEQLKVAWLSPVQEGRETRPKPHLLLALL